MKSLPQLQKLIHENAVNHGWWGASGPLDPIKDTSATTLAVKVGLIMAEGAEALEELRKNTDPRHIYYRDSDHKPEGFQYELADIIIRCMDTAEACGINLYGAIREKMDFNVTRPMKHGKEF